MDKLILIEKFKNPDVSYRGKPFWSWNGELDGDELVRQARIMKEMGLGGYFMHSRSGLITEYLSDEWFDLICKVADESEKLGLEAWLYDEDRWPSGSAGGMVTRDRRFSMKSLYLHEYDVDARPEIEGDTVAIFVGVVDGINLLSYVRVENDSIDCIDKVKIESYPDGIQIQLPRIKFKNGKMVEYDMGYKLDAFNNYLQRHNYIKDINGISDEMLRVLGYLKG